MPIGIETGIRKSIEIGTAMRPSSSTLDVHYYSADSDKREIVVVFDTTDTMVILRHQWGARGGPLRAV
jgi:hypothetical protein